MSKRKLEEGPLKATPTPPRAPPDAHARMLVHWNVGGLNGLLNNEQRHALLLRLVSEHKPDVLGISEHKCSRDKYEAVESRLNDKVPGYAAHWAIAERKGYSGVLVLVRDGVEVHSVEIDPVSALQSEGRVVTLELDDVYVVNVYVPNSGQKLERLDFRCETWDPAFAEYIAGLEKKKPVVITGDMNVAPLDADIWNYDSKAIAKQAGLTPRERHNFRKLTGQLDADTEPQTFATVLTDAYRLFWPEAAHCFSYWSVRSKGKPMNKGLRLDHVLVSKSLVGGTKPGPLLDSQILYDYAPNGDHAPVALYLAPA